MKHAGGFPLVYYKLMYEVDTSLFTSYNKLVICDKYILYWKPLRYVMLC